MRSTACGEFALNPVGIGQSLGNWQEANHRQNQRGYYSMHLTDCTRWLDKGQGLNDYLLNR